MHHALKSAALTVAGIRRIKPNDLIKKQECGQTLGGGPMSMEGTRRAPSARVIVVGNEKGGSGKSTVAIHIAIALIKSG